VDVAARANRMIFLLLVIPAAVLVLAYVAQRRLMYFPERSSVEDALQRASRLGLEPWRLDGVLVGWRDRSPPDGARAVLVVLHGNAGAAHHRAYFVEAFRAAAPALPLDVRLLEYPGYGPRPGVPTEETLVAAAREALAAARAEGKGPVFLAGESLGSGVAALAAAADPAAVDGLVLVTPLASIPAVARRHYPFLPAAFYRDSYRADRALVAYGRPVAFLLAGDDRVVFTDIGRALFETHSGPKRLWVEERAGHNTLTWDPRLPRWREIVEFLAGG
jgi:uncharacterized protein